MEQFSRAPRAQISMFLATDLDGTFLAGDEDKRRKLYRLVERREDVLTAWVTGRGLEAVIPLIADPAVPNPDYVICDVGATVVDGAGLNAVEPLQSDIEARWPGEHCVAVRMQRFDALERQPVPQRRRCSYYCKPAQLRDISRELERAVAEMDCDIVYSADRFLDILPRRTDKGRTLQALIEHLEIEPERVLTAGDTLNDLSMYMSGFKGVCVGDSEPALLDATRKLANVMHADAPGCGGILEAIERYGLVDEPAATAVGREALAYGSAKLVMAYHRPPFEQYVKDGVRRRRRHASPNGIIPSLLSFFRTGAAGSWIAWQERIPGVEDQPRQTVDDTAYPNLVSALVPLDRDEITVFYKRFSKEAFWPVINTFWERAVFKEVDWRVFKRVNDKFAEAAAAEAAEGATVWIHDYNLWLVPARLRQLRPDVRIAFFHHTHFPPADIFNVIPWHREILGSLLACDYVGFHVPRQVENFVDTVRSAFPVTPEAQKSCAPRFLTYGCAVGLDRMTTRLRFGNRHVHVGAHPIGTDVRRIAETLALPKVQCRIAAIREEMKGRKVVFSIERLDYGKGILQKIHAFERLLDGNAELIGNVTLLLVCAPADKAMTVYRGLQTQIEQAVGALCGKHSNLEWVPVRFFSRSLPFDEVVAHYAAADVMWITPLRDGLNLVAKEYVATHGVNGSSGTLVLSEFAGAAAELKGAILTNPHDPLDMQAALLQALTMTQAERANRLRTLFGVVSTYDLERWGREFLEAVDATAVEDA